MKTLNQYIKEKLIINRDYRDVNIYHPKSFDKLRNIIEYRYKKLGPGTKENPIDFNDVDVSHIDSFCDKNIGIFEKTKFKYIDISYWDVSNITDMKYMFYDCEELESVGDLSNWNVSNVTDMNSMFCNCKELEYVGDISEWDISKVINMPFMFWYCTSFNQDLSCWNVSNVIYKDSIFHNCPIKNEYKPKFK